MARKPVSLQDLIRSRQQSGFVGRRGQLLQYQENLDLPADDGRRQYLFDIYGDAGVGKTYLTRQLRQVAIGRGALTAYVDETADDVTAAMNAISAQFAQAGVRLGEFGKRADAYRRRRQELECDPQAPDDIATFLTKTAVTIGLAAVRDVPVAGNLIASVDAARATEQVNRARMYLARRLGDHADLRLLLSPADELTPVFVAELNRVAESRPITLFIDTYERSGLVLEHWLRRLYDGYYGDLPMTLITTISGQRRLDPNLWGDYLPVISEIPLKPFSDAEARQFLTSKNIQDESMIRVILSLSGRLPLWLATLAEARPGSVSEIGDPAGDAVERFLKWEDDPLRRRIAKAAALPRRINQDVLAAIAGAGDMQELFSWLCGLPFVKRQAESWTYHEVVRAAMLRLLLAQAPTEWKARQIALAGVHRRWAHEAAGATGNAWSNPGWIDHVREQTYHLLCADPDANLAGALASAVKAAENSAIRARQWAELIADAGRDTDHREMLRWGMRLNEGIHDDDVTRYFTELINDADLDKSTLSTALRQRGNGYRIVSRNDDALADFNRAIGLNPCDDWALARRGATYLAMERYDEALADLNRALELNPAHGWALARRGATYRDMGLYDKSLADFNRALELDPTHEFNSVHAWAIAMRGDTFRLMGRYDEAQADIDRALELDPDRDWIVASRGEIYRRMERYDEALADIDRAIELNPGDAWAIAIRGETYLGMRRYDEALADLNRAIELNPAHRWARARRGATYRDMGLYDKALADFNRALELNPGDAWAIAIRGETFRLMGRYDEALADLNRALELEPDRDWIVASRGATFQVMERYGEALAHLSHAIELNPENAWAIASRGQVYQATQCFDDALADFSRALELDPDREWVIASRGKTYRSLERYGDALADLNRAIELNPRDDDYASERVEILRLIGKGEDALPPPDRELPP